MYKLWGRKVLFRMRMRPKISAGGLFLPGRGERSVIGEVVVAGDECRSVKVGDKILYGAYEMNEIEPELFLMDEENILAILEGDDDDQIDA